MSLCVTKCACLDVDGCKTEALISLYLPPCLSVCLSLRLKQDIHRKTLGDRSTHNVTVWPTLTPVAEWATDSKLKMNDGKTELIAIGIMSSISQVSPNLTPVSISGYDMPFSHSIRNLGVFVDEILSMDAHIRYPCRILFCQLRRLGKIHPFLSTDAANKLAVSFILTRLDY